MPRDAARATILALGLSFVGQACGGQTDGDNDPSAPGAGASIGTGTGGTGNGFGGTVGRPDTDPCSNPLASTCPAPPYGGMPRPLPAVGGAAGSSGSVGLPDASTPPDPSGQDAGSSDAGPEDAGG
ncbi:MAG: hypothetical protein ABI895_33240 [Deltaproteobacteria bacterium]